MIALSAHAEGTLVPVRAQPGARKEGVLGERAGALRIAVSASPERGKANAAVGRVLAESLGCKASQVALVSGETSREKRFLVSGLAVEEVRRRLAPLLASSAS
jgi:uncharacterized protein (TIGR00251 family)